MSLSIAQVEDSIVFQTGQEVMANNGVVLFGMSPGNACFKSRVIEDCVEYLGKEKKRIIVVVPQQPAEHTYRALGSKDAVKRTKKNSSQLKSHCRRAIEKVSKSRRIKFFFKGKSGYFLALLKCKIVCRASQHIFVVWDFPHFVSASDIYSFICVREQSVCHVVSTWCVD